MRERGRGRERERETETADRIAGLTPLGLQRPSVPNQSRTLVAIDPGRALSANF